MFRDSQNSPSLVAPSPEQTSVISSELGSRYRLPSRASDGLQELRAGRRRTGDDVQRWRSPMRGHLPAAGSRVGRRAHRLQQHFLGRHAQRQAKRAVAIIRIKPIVPGLNDKAGRDLHRLMPRAADLKKDPVLALQQDFAVVQMRERYISRKTRTRVSRSSPSGSGAPGRSFSGAVSPPAGKGCNLVVTNPSLSLARPPADRAASGYIESKRE